MAPWLLNPDLDPTETPVQAVSARPSRDVTLSLDAAGPPQTWLRALAEIAGAEVGLWSIDVGEVDDVESEEVAIILEGRASIHVTGAPSVEVGPGDILRLEEGTATHWIVHKRLTKVYVTAR
jgi:uncharacterized cupin superfamily protein